MLQFFHFFGNAQKRKQKKLIVLELVAACLDIPYIIWGICDRDRDGAEVALVASRGLIITHKLFERRAKQHFKDMLVYF